MEEVPDIDSQSELSLSEEDNAPNIDAEFEQSVESETGSIQIAPTAETSILGQEDDPMLFIELGDRIVIDSKKYGRTTGTVYYRSLELIRIKPDGISNLLRDFVVDNEGAQEEYAEEDGVTAAYVIEKRKFDSFVEQQDFRVGQVIDTFLADGSIDKSYKIIKVDEDEDQIVLEDPEDPEPPKVLSFEFIGIPRDENFIMISVQSYVDEPPVKEDDEDKIVENLEEVEEPEQEAKIIGFIEVAVQRVFREAASYEQSIPDNLQKMDALNDFMSGLDVFLQKDPKAIRNVRILVETLFYLKQLTVAFNDDGTIQGVQNVSAETLDQLIQQTPIPLGRAILNVSKKEYETGDLDDADFDFVHFENFEQELERSIQLTNITDELRKKERWEWVKENAFITEMITPWKPSDQDANGWKALADTDFFRILPPSEDDNGNMIKELIPGYKASHDKEIPPIFAEIPFGVERALATTYRKGSDDRSKDVFIQEDKSNMNGYLLFPTHLANYLGITRSESLAIDSGRSQLPPKTMRMILKETGIPKENATTKDIYFLNLLDGQSANIELADYVDGISVPALGLGDTFSTLQQYGVENLELNEKLVNVLLGKISSYQSQLLSSLAKLREMVQQVPPSPVANPFLVDPEFLNIIRGQPTLVEDLQEFENVNPGLVGSDLGMVIHLMKRHANYFQVAAGGNNLLIAKSLYQSNRNNYINQLLVATTLQKNELNKGERPKKNPCRHVADLVSVRRIREDAERFEQLSKVFRMYQGNRDQNWIDCTICKEHLICIHERLQLQAYLNPKEKGVLEKEIILKCSGGQFQGKYICRNCGQAIRELDFDNNMEFDDDGKPKSGSSVLVDEDAKLEEKLDLLTSVPIEPPEFARLNLSKNEQVCYHIIHTIADKVGISLDQNGYRRTIEYVMVQSRTFPTKDAHNERRKSKPGLAEYEAESSRLLITACGCALLIEIQTKFPAYPVHHILAGCSSPGFDGYPLTPELSEIRGLTYIACAISSVQNKSPPWNLTGFQKVADTTKRMNAIMIYLTVNMVGNNPQKILKGMAITDMVQSRLQSKRKYLAEMKDHQSNYPTDQIFASFLPEQILLRKEDAAKDAIVPEVAAHMGNKGQTSLMRMWIRQAHQVAQETVSLVRGSPLIEATCCTVKLQEPESFWASQDGLPELPLRRLQPNKQGSFLLTEFHPREAEAGVVEAEKGLYYRLFLKCCFDGPRKGHAHEPGLTNQCTWCGFQFPEHPSIMKAEEEGKPELARQEVNTDTDAFVDLLDTIHIVNQVKPVEPMIASTMEIAMLELAAVEPMPIDDWEDIMIVTIDRFKELGNSADKQDIAQAVVELADASREQILIVKDKFKKNKGFAELLDAITNLSWVDFFNVVRMYFIVPFKRLLSNFDLKHWKVPVELVKDLSQDHVEKYLQPILNNEIQSFNKRQETMAEDAIQEGAVPLMTLYVEQMSVLLPFMNSIRPGMVPGGNITLRYIQKCIFYGPLATMITASVESSSLLKGIPMQFLLQLVADSIVKFDRERMSYDEKTIRDKIAIRDEKERTNVIKEFDRLTPEERAVELTNKRYGLGKWAVGGTKLIYAYDKDYFDQERQKRLDAGIIDFPGHADGSMFDPEGRAVDDYGFPEYDGEEEGYSHNQHADDDYE
uniref:Uncharacterized protein n=1 Tax=viral metagenome TaxID=1070528 RepID=A0A6C0KRP9_9ZZZZ